MQIVSNTASAHVYFQVVKRPKNFFKGVQTILSTHKNVVIKEIILSDYFYNIIDDAEYAKVLFYQKASELKIIKRIKNYGKVFREFEKLTQAFIEENKTIKCFFFYFADEGVWGEFGKLIQTRFQKKYQIKITLINIQHGFFSLNDMGARYARKIVNSVSKKLLKYPFLGKGFGGSLLDTYFVYGELEKKLIQKKSPNSIVLVSPAICKYEMLEQIFEKQKNTLPTNNIDKHILFAAQLNEIGHDCLLSEEEITIKIAPLFKTLKNLGYKIFYRLHPAIINKQPFLNLLDKYGITENVTLDNDCDISDSLLKVSSILSLQSTVLYDGYIAGRMPIIVRGLLNPFEFTTPHEEIDINHPLENQIKKVFNQLPSYYKEKIELNFESDIIKYFTEITKTN